MIELNRLSVLDLSERSALVEVKDSVDELVRYRQRPEALTFLRTLESRLRYLTPTQLGSLVPEYERLMMFLKFVCFADLTERDQLQLIQKNAVDIFATDLALADVIEQRLVELDVDGRDDFKHKVQNALIRNQQRLTSKALAIGADGRPEQPTVGNWVRDYTYTLGSDLAGPLEQAQYFTNSPNFKALTKVEQERVHAVLSLYERYKYDSTSIEGFDGAMAVEYRRRLYLLANGELTSVEAPQRTLHSAVVGNLDRIRPVTPAPAAVAPPRIVDVATALRTLRQQHAAADETRYQAQETLLRQAGPSVDRLVVSLRQALQVNDHPTVVAATLLLARSGAVASAVRDEAVRAAFVREQLTALATQARIPIEAVRRAIEAQSETPGVVAAFTRWILERSLGGNATEAAWVGNQVESAMAALGNPEIVGMTTLDVTAGRFRWSSVTIRTDGTLVLAG